MNLATRLAITLCLLGGSAPGAPPAVARPATYHSAKGMMRAIVLNMGDEGRSVTDARYDSLFRSGDATQGVEQMIRAGRFFINGMAMPATAEDFAKTCPGGYLVNQIAWLKRDAVTGAWKGGFKSEKPAASYEAAALASATGIVAGLEVRLYDTDHDGFADQIEADYKEGVTVGRVLHRRNGTFSVRRADHGVGPAAGAATGEGRAFDSAHFTATSRDAIAISNRPGEFVNAQKFFGFDKDQRGAKTSLWLVPTTQAGKQGEPVALTSAVAKMHLSAAKVSADGHDVPATGTWASAQAHVPKTGG